MPNDEEYKNVSKNLETYGYKDNYVVTHTAPTNMVEYMSRMNMGIKNTVIEETSLTDFLQWVIEKNE